MRRLGPAALLLLFAPSAHGGLATASASSPAPVDLAAYRAHLSHLLQLVDRCSLSPDLAHCDSKQVGGPDRVLIPGASQPREVHYEWLSDTFTRVAAAKLTATATPAKPAQGAPAANSAKKAPDSKDPAGNDSSDSKDADANPDPQALLAAARQHLLTDLNAAGGSAASSTAIAAPPNHPAQRQQVHAILAEREFDQVKPPSAWDRAVEAFFNWLNNRINRIQVGHAGGWVTLAFEWGLVIAAATGLAWWLIRGTQREHWRLEHPEGGPRDAPSLRDWQIWLAEADAFAAQGQWREAIHSVYWAAISRLESRGLWPVDRARTPREYIQLVLQTDPRRPDLIALTRAFERIWYGYRNASEPDYRSAVHLVSQLTGGPSA